jgi:hypothetical protein
MLGYQEDGNVWAIRKIDKCGFDTFHGRLFLHNEPVATLMGIHLSYSRQQHSRGRVLRPIN